MIITQPLKIGKCDYIPLSLFKEQIKLPQNMVENISVIAKTTVDVPENWIKNAIDTIPKSVATIIDESLSVPLENTKLTKVS